MNMIPRSKVVSTVQKFASRTVQFWKNWRTKYLAIAAEFWLLIAHLSELYFFLTILSVQLAQSFVLFGAESKVAIFELFVRAILMLRFLQLNLKSKAWLTITLTSFTLVFVTEAAVYRM